MTTHLLDLSRLLLDARPSRPRTMREWAEQEVVLPTGPYKGELLSFDRQPVTRLLFDEIDSGRWRRVAITGPGQSSKSLSGFIIPTLYYIFELNETVVLGTPDLAMAGDKWRNDLLPVIEHSRYAHLLPKTGAGARGARNVVAIQFQHGPTLRFMSAGASEKAQAGFTARAVVLTEVDGYDTASETDREADPVTRIEARNAAYGAHRRTHMECTVSTKEGRIWSEIEQGTGSRIACPCAHCGAWFVPEREHLQGWRDCADILSARANGGLVCPSCGAMWSEEDRHDAMQQARLVHRGQEIGPGGEIAGEAPAVDTLGFRYSAAHNMLVPIAEVAAEEWRSLHSAKPDMAERRMRQFFWAIPTEETSDADAVEITAAVVERRIGDRPRGVVPSGIVGLGLGVDVGKHLLHWSLVAETADGSLPLIDYGRVEVPSRDLGEERALAVAFAGLADLLSRGWPSAAGGDQQRPSQVIADAGYAQPEVFRACALHGWLPAKGFSSADRRYLGPRRSGAAVAVIGEGWHLVRLARGARRVDLDADRWKSMVHDRLLVEVGKAGGLTLPRETTAAEHLSLTKHLTAETKRREWVNGREVERWRNDARAANHWLDATAMALAALRVKSPAPMRYASPVRVVMAPAPDARPEVAPEQPKPAPTQQAAPQADVGGWFASKQRR